MSEMSISALRRFLESELQKLGIEKSEVRAESDLIIRQVCGMSLAEEMKEPAKVINEKTLASVLEIIEKRRQRCPLQYLLLESEFYGQRFALSPGVLIPRADTETLIEEARQYLESLKPSSATPALIGEIGCGSGIIALTLLRLYPQTRAVVCDISSEAINISNQNAEALGVSDRYQASLSDWRVFLATEGKKLDMLLSNPPYIPYKDRETLAPEVRLYEPESALFGPDEDGLGFYRGLATSKNLVGPNCRVILEIGFGQCANVQDIFQKEGWHITGVRKDLNGIDRAVSFVQ